MASFNLIQKYNQPTPRYTSYPPVPLWDEKPFGHQDWATELKKFWSVKPNEPSQVYIHLPYCENLCTFCVCNKRITKNHSLELPYIEAVLKEWKMYQILHGGPIPISEIHLGGGTPTFFSNFSLKKLISGILDGSKNRQDIEMAIEIHPGITTKSQIHALAKLGFKRLSIGIQDFSPFILKKINRNQTFEQTRELVNEARKAGFHSLNFDLVYGLPFQTKENISETISKTIGLNPDRIAFYGYAHVPWKSKGQRHFTESDLPEGLEKWQLFELGSQLLKEAGFEAIGLDHFAKKEDGLALAFKENKLHRNFMGYTDQKAELLIGLGASAIGETPNAYAQNHPIVEVYLEEIIKGKLPISKGHLLSKADLFWKTHILNLMCHQETRFDVLDFEVRERIGHLEEDGLISYKNGLLKILPKGHPFMRNICQALDHRHWSRLAAKPQFSKAV